MGLWDKIRAELIDIIEWTEPSQSDILAYRFPRYDNEIKIGAQLTVREGQAAVVVNEGQIADVFGPGRQTLETQNLPVLSTLRGWKYGFHSPFKAEVYFVSTRQWTDQKWGTQNPLMLRDAEFGPVRLADPKKFLRQLVATDPSFQTYEITHQLRNTIVSRFADVIGQAKIPILELAGNYERMSGLALERIAPDLAAMGLELTAFYIENISVPAEVEKALDERTKMGVIGNLGQYTQFQAAQAMRDAAQNPGGLAGAAAGIGAGVAIGNQIAGAMAAPPPVPFPATYYLAIDGEQSGPFELPAVAAKARSGQLTSGTLVWKQGMTSWTAAESVPELRALLAAMPPLPKI
jgi:membrane protease subunit (stomatin/prohibitin family)